MSILERAVLFFNKAEFVSSDYYGNNYYLLKETDKFERKVRYVKFKNKKNASSIPPLWSGWLRYSMSTETLKAELNKGQKSFVKFHHPNLTGSNFAYSPTQSVKEHNEKTAIYHPWIN